MSTFSVPSTSTEYSNSRLLSLPGVTMDARCTTICGVLLLNNPASSAERTSARQYSTPGQPPVGRNIPHIHTDDTPDGGPIGGERRKQLRTEIAGRAGDQDRARIHGVTPFPR